MKEIIGSIFSACVILTFAGCSGSGRFAPTSPAGAGQDTANRTVPVRARSESDVFRVLYSFQNGSDGAVPSTSLIADKHGDLFGTATNVGGVTSCNVHCGSIFELSPPASKSGHWTFTILYIFKGGKDGGLPEGNVMFGPDGSLYGTANVGGRYTKYGGGVVFQLKPSGTHWTEHVLHYFGRNGDGTNPHGGLVADRKGNLYGTTADGGALYCAGGCGVVYELSPASNAETVLYSFSGGEDGGTPLAGLTIDGAGHLYGTTEFGGYFSSYCQGGCGTVFELSPPPAPGDPWKYAVIHQFSGGVPGEGALPLDPVMRDRSGNLYGTTFVSQSSGGGTAFELSHPHRNQPWVETVLYRFPEYPGDAANSRAGFISDSSGNLYATSQNGGSRFKGNAFKLIPPAMPGGAWTDAVLYTFLGVRNGATYPATNLVFGAGGLLYGTTPYGGSGNCVFTKIKGCGTIFGVHP